MLGGLQAEPPQLRAVAAVQMYTGWCTDVRALERKERGGTLNSEHVVKTTLSRRY